MMPRAGVFALLCLLAACSSEPEPKQSKAPQTPAKAEDTTASVKAEKKSIEEAAEAAVKLIEEEAQQEIGEISPTPKASPEGDAEQ
jgi:PBP1b-binding outer membrane lipoprotein LpoB